MAYGNKEPMKRVGLIALLLTVAATPKGVVWVPMFQLLRNKNANVVEYGVRIEPSGLLDTDRPLEADWLLKAEDGRREGLSFFERSFAYGIDWKVKTPGEVYEATLVCCKDRDLLVLKRNGRYEADTKIGGIPSRLVRIMVTADESSTPPKVESVELYGSSTAGEAPTYELVRPH
jgi:Domain of unknown function (DUF4833)